ncbi:glycosyltransferase [Methylomarinum sp. Ch1-1]|uniref:Glycosyltransferase n=1 Tax=Methylomarinum roseum TaxID=3067653 RepID=A0AAU7NVX5_9GAMM
MRVYVSVAFYLPGFKAGGPIKTIQNMVTQLDGDLEFWIVTRDRDLGDTEVYPSVQPNEWMELDSSKVLYLSPDHFNVKSFAKVINDANFDVLYLNSFFDVNFSIKPLIARRLGLIKPCPLVLAPRGEFSKGALALKAFKKKLYINLANWFGLYTNITWQASSELEKIDILNALNVDPASIFIAKDLPEKKSRVSNDQNNQVLSEVRLVFLSRISPMKNLNFALRVLSNVKSSLIFDIYGPIEDENYWQSCLKWIDALPKYIKVNYCGAVNPAQVSHIFSHYDLFFFPTRGENYGHVIAESLSVGTPVLTSDQTPWLNLSDDNLGWDLPLESESLFIEKIEQVANMSRDARSIWRKQVMERASSRVNSDADVADNKALFEFAIKRFKNK